MNGFERETHAKMIDDTSYDWCAQASKEGKPMLNCLDLTFRESFTAISKTCFSMRQKEDLPHGFFEVSVVDSNHSQAFSITLGLQGKPTQAKTKKGDNSSNATQVCPKWGWILAFDDAATRKENKTKCSDFGIVSGWAINDTIGVLCNFRDRSFSLYRNGIKESNEDIFWSGTFEMFPFLEASHCMVKMCFEYDICKYKPLEFSVSPGIPIPFEIFEWKRPCVLCKSRFATHMYMCDGTDNACHKFVVCSACFHSGKEFQCPHQTCTHCHSERVAFHDQEDKIDNVCKYCQKPFLKHELAKEKHPCSEGCSVNTVWTFQSVKVEFAQHDSHTFRRIETPFDFPDDDDFSSSEIIDRATCKPIFGELWVSTVNPTSELRMMLLNESFDSDSSEKNKIGVVIETDSLCEPGCTKKHRGYCVRCSKHFSFHKFGRMCKDRELSMDFGLTNDTCSRCSRSIGDHDLVHLCPDDEIGRFHKRPNDQRLFIAVEDSCFVVKRGRIKRLVPDPGPHSYRQVVFLYIFAQFFPHIIFLQLQNNPSEPLQCLQFFQHMRPNAQVH